MTLPRIQPFIIVSVTFLFEVLSAQQKVIAPDLTKIVKGEGWKVINRIPDVVEENGQTYIHFQATDREGGIAWLENVEFTNGTIDVDIKGKNVKGGSFLGIAFRGENDSTYDAVYFRPFNFDSLSNVKGRSVQYISHPEYTWYKLRDAFPGKYENSVTPAPDPDEFFHVKIIVNKPEVRVYVDGSKESSLVVNEISERSGGKIGLWMDFVSEGSFANLKIIPAKD